MTNTFTTRRTRYRASTFALSAAALIIGNQFAAAGKPHPNITTAVAAASTTEIEDIVELGLDAGTQIARQTVKLSTTNVNALVSGLTKAIARKDSAGSGNPKDPDRTENKVDEIGEVAAYVFGAISGDNGEPGSNELTSNLGLAKKYALAVMQSALKKTLKTVAFLRTDIVTDVVGSVALTIHSDPGYDEMEVKLQKSLLKSARKIAGKAHKRTVIDALNAGFAGDPLTSGFENGSDLPVALIADPETDFRNS